MLTALLATSLYAASLNPPQPKEAVPLYPVRVEKIANPLATDAVFILSGWTLDHLTTAGAIERGCYEANPLLHNLERRIVLKSGIAGGRLLVQYGLRRYGKHKVANALRYIGGAVDLGVSVNNYRCGR